MRVKTLLVVVTITVGVGAFWLARNDGAHAGGRVGQPAPEITGGPWINSEALSMQTLRGRVVFVEFWTYG
jgi:hypothetical protein